MPAPRSRRAVLRRVWSEVWRVGLAGLVGAVLLGFLLSEAEDGGWLSDREPLYALDALVGLIALGLLLLRRRWPFATAFVLACTGFVASSSVPATGIAVISLATHRRWRPLVAVAVPWVIGGYVYDRWLNPTPDSDYRLTLGFGVLLYALCVALGYYIGTRRELLQRLRERAEDAELQQSLRVARARIEERHRIAREMHDVLAHRISLIAMHSGALAYRTDLPPSQVTEAAGLIRDTSHQALDELRTVLGVLRRGDTEDTPDGPGSRDPEPPQPTLAELPALLSEGESVGLTVRSTTPVDLAGVPPTLSRNAYRIIQEALTNARKHGDGQPVDLRVTGALGEGLTLRVRNTLPVRTPNLTSTDAVPGAGLGLAGASERAALAGGRLEAGVDRSGAFVLEAWLPWPT